MIFFFSPYCRAMSFFFIFSRDQQSEKCQQLPLLAGGLAHGIYCK